MVLKRSVYITLSNQKLKGNTLIEVLMSLSILSLVFMLGMGLMQQVTGIYSPVQRFRTRNILHQELEKTDFLFVPFEEEVEVLGRRIQRKVSWLDPKHQVVQLSVSCYWGEWEIAARHKIIHLKNRQRKP